MRTRRGLESGMSVMEMSVIDTHFTLQCSWMLCSHVEFLLVYSGWWVHTSLRNSTPSCTLPRSSSTKSSATKPRPWVSRQRWRGWRETRNNWVRQVVLCSPLLSSVVHFYSSHCSLKSLRPPWTRCSLSQSRAQGHELWFSPVTQEMWDCLAVI